MAKLEGISRRRALGMLATATPAAMMAGCGGSPHPGPTVFPGEDWMETPPGDLGMIPERLDRAAAFLSERAGKTGWHVIVIRNGHLVLDRGEGTDPLARRPVASLGKSLFVSTLGIAIEEGMIGSADDLLIDHYPEIAGAHGKHGPYPDAGRHFSKDDEGVTLRHLATHTGGFMRPNEPPGSQWTYDTFGMACLIHAIAKRYGYYDSANPHPERSGGTLIEEKIRDPIGAAWTWRYLVFSNHPPEARLNLFSHYVEFHMAPRRDLARLGLLWLANGRWKNRQIIPEAWHRQSIQVAEEVKACEPEERWIYGHGFWVNETGRLWPDLPRDSYMAAGFPNHKLWICPSLSLVVVASPGLEPRSRFENTVADPRFLEKVAASVR